MKAITKQLYRLKTHVFLILAVLVAMVPFLDVRMLRMAGDEKVYLTQSVEMARAGNWFVQTLADEPSYFKGPMHYLLVRVGMIFFGNHLIAGTWMNAAFALLAGLAMYWLGRRRWNDKIGLLLGTAVALNVGIFSHAIVSQMEVEVSAFYALAVAALGLAKKRHGFKNDLWFWLAAGLVGWSKSPVHSVLIGVGGIVYWAWTKQLMVRLRDKGSWLAVFTGIAVCFLGYAPAYIFDHQNFIDTYILREQLQKANNARTWDYVTKPLLHFSLPWTFVIMAALFKVIKARKKTVASADIEMLKLGLAMAAPTILFWCTWSYKGQNYNLPAMPALLLFAWAAFKGNIPSGAIKAAGALGLLVLFAAIALVLHFSPLPGWWGTGWLTLAFISIGVFVLAFLFSEDTRVWVVGATAFIFAFGAFIAPIGEREMIDMRQYIKDHPGVTYHYYNLDPSIWSEWALLQLTLHHPIYGLHRREQLAVATKPGHAVIVQNMDWLNVVLKYWRESGNRGKKPIITPWTRWLTKGKTQEGKSQWKVAWENRDLHQLEREFYIIQF